MQTKEVDFKKAPKFWPCFFIEMGGSKTLGTNGVRSTQNQLGKGMPILI